MLNNYTMKLCDFSTSPKDIFLFNYNLTHMIKKKFENLFYLTYYDYEIGFDYPGDFIRKLEAKLLGLTPVYNNLVKTQMINVSNPLVNYMMKKEYVSSNKNKSRSYNNSTGKRTNSNDELSGGYNTNTSTNDEKENKISLNLETANNKDVSENVNDERQLNLFSDSPQAPLENEKSFNDGYITNKTLNEQSIKNKNSEREVKYDKTGKNEGVDISGKTIDNNVKSEFRNIVENNRDIINSVNSSGNLFFGNGFEKIEGIKGTTLSQIIADWRSIQVNFTQKLVDECRDLFLYIY